MRARRVPKAHLVSHHHLLTSKQYRQRHLSDSRCLHDTSFHPPKSNFARSALSMAMEDAQPSPCLLLVQDRATAREPAQRIISISCCVQHSDTHRDIYRRYRTVSGFQKHRLPRTHHDCQALSIMEDHIVISQDCIRHRVGQAKMSRWCMKS